MRVARLDLAEVHHRMYGVQGAVAMAKSRRGGQLDPAIVDGFAADADALFPGPGDDPWERALALAPDSETHSTRPASMRCSWRSVTSSTSSARSPWATPVP